MSKPKRAPGNRKPAVGARIVDKEPGEDRGAEPAGNQTGDTGGGSPNTEEATFLSPLAPPGPPPQKKRGRPNKADLEAEEKAKAATVVAEEKKRREEQAADASKFLTPVLKLASRFALPEEKALTEEECKEISGAGSALLCKYVDLRGIEKYQEEITFTFVVGKAILKRVEINAPATGERDRGESRDGEKPTP